MQNPFDEFGRIYCINLDSRPDRWAAVQHQFQRVGIAERVRRFPGIVPENGPSSEGCGRSHLEIVRNAQREGCRNVLVLEDDVHFMPDALTTLRQTLKQLKPRHWDVLYLGATTSGRLKNVAANVVRIRNCYASHALCYNASIFETVLAELKPSEHLVDVWLRLQVQERFRCYGAYPLVATQSPGFSDIVGSEVAYRFIETNYRTRPTSRITPFPDAEKTPVP